MTPFLCDSDCYAIFDNKMHFNFCVFYAVEAFQPQKHKMIIQIQKKHNLLLNIHLFNIQHPTLALTLTDRCALYILHYLQSEEIVIS